MKKKDKVLLAFIVIIIILIAFIYLIINNFFIRGTPPLIPPLEEMKKCELKEDCVPVGCYCDCSGCGGFSYEQIINKKYEIIWYKKYCGTTFKPGERACPEVCCVPQRDVGCENNVCVVIEGQKYYEFGQ